MSINSINDLSKIDIKYQLIESGWLDFYSKFRRTQYLKEYDLEEYISLSDEYKKYESFPTKTFTEKQLRCLIQLYDSRRKKVYRLRKKIKQMLMFPCVFLTLTFKDSFLDSTSDKTRRTYVARFLKSQGDCRYVANIDFGQDDRFTKREHYHALIQTDKVNFADWKCGAINGQKVTVRNSLALSKYIAKLTSHAYKDGASSTRLIFSRNFDDGLTLERVVKGQFQTCFTNYLQK